MSNEITPGRFTLHESVLPEMPKLNPPAVPPNTPQPPSSSISDTPLKQTDKNSIFRSLSLKSKAFPSSPSQSSSRNTPYKTKQKTPSLILRGFSESMAKIPNILPKSLQSPKPETPKHRRVYTVGSLRRTQTSGPTDTFEDFEIISTFDPESPCDARLHLKRMSHSGMADGRLFTSPPFGSHIPFPKLTPSSPKQNETVYLRGAPRSSDDLRAHLDERCEKAISPGEKDDIDSQDAQAEEDTARDRFLRIAMFLQKATRHAREKGVLSQESVFRDTAPLLLFVFVLGIGVFLPRYYSALQTRFGCNFTTYIILLVLGGASSILLLLRGAIWVMSVLAQSFCEMDLAAFFRQGECISADDTRMGEAELVLWSFLFG